MSLKAISWVWDSSTAQGTDLLVFLAIADYADGEGECWPHQDLVAGKSRVSLRTVQRSIENLVRSGELQIRRTGRGNRYILPMRQSDVIRHSYDVSDTSDCHVRYDKGGGSDTPLLADAYEPSLTVNEPKALDAPLKNEKVNGDSNTHRPAAGWVQPPNFVEDLNQLPEKQVDDLDDEAKGRMRERIRMLKGGQA